MKPDFKWNVPYTSPHPVSHDKSRLRRKIKISGSSAASFITYLNAPGDVCHFKIVVVVFTIVEDERGRLGAQTASICKK